MHIPVEADPQPAQRSRQWLLLLALAVLCLTTLPAFPSPRPGDDPGITAIQVNGRTIYVNNEAAGAAAHSTQRRVLVYWSRAERRWKPVPRPTPSVMRAARSAAREVSSYVAARPRTEAESAAASDPNYAALAHGYAVSAAEIDRAIQDSAQRHNVDANLVRAIIKVESNYNPGAVSRKGAMGLMQLMPSTAQQLNVSNPFDPEENVDAGVRHLKHLLDNFGGDLQLSLAAYNAGAGAVTRNNGVPPYAETQNYVKRITQIYGSGDVHTLGASSRPIRVYRGTDGVLRISNVE
jgi:soluble lytic murein transglycosylase-like protein